MSTRRNRGLVCKKDSMAELARGHAEFIANHMRDTVSCPGQQFELRASDGDDTLPNLWIAIIPEFYKVFHKSCGFGIRIVSGSAGAPSST